MIATDIREVCSLNTLRPTLVLTTDNDLNTLQRWVKHNIARRVGQAGGFSWYVCEVMREYLLVEEGDLT